MEITICSPNRNDLKYTATVKSVIENSKFSWLGHFLFPGVFDGKHIFNITKNEGGCLLVQKENFSGFLVLFFGAASIIILARVLN